MDLDDIDRALLDALQDDGRASVQTLAAEAGVAVETAERRIEAMEDAGVIRGYTATVDYGRLGYDVTGVVRLRVDGVPEATAERLETYPWARAIYEVTGADDFLVVGTFRDTEAMHGRVAELLTEQSVRSITVDVVLETVRECEPLSIPTHED